MIPTDGDCSIGENKLIFLLDELKKHTGRHSYAIRKIYTTLHDGIFRAVRSISNDLDDLKIEEVINKTLLRVTEKAHTFNGTTDKRAKNWITQIAVNIAKDLLRKQQREEKKMGLISIDDPSNNIVIQDKNLYVEELVIAREENGCYQKQIADFLQVLSKRELEVLNLVLQGKKNFETAEILDISRSRVTQIRKAIKGKAKKYGLGK